jgi:hypothetical protein
LTGLVKFEDFVKYFNDFLAKYGSEESANPILENLDPELEFTFHYVFEDTIKIIKSGLEKILAIFKNEERYRASQTIEVSERDYK